MAWPRHCVSRSSKAGPVLQVRVQAGCLGAQAWLSQRAAAQMWRISANGCDESGDKTPVLGGDPFPSFSLSRVQFPVFSHLLGRPTRLS